MGRKLAVALAAASFLIGTPADAQMAGLFGKLAGLPPKGEAGGTYQSKNRVRTYVTADPSDTAPLYRKLIAKAVDMADARGFPRIGVTRAECDTVFVSNSPRSMSCTVAAAMLQAGETTEPVGKRDVLYFDRDDVRRGAIVPLPE